jgi:16S rRNA G966 N2-methylase RsmD
MYGRDIEDYKRALHYAVVFGDYEPMLKCYGIDLSEIGGIADMRRRRIAASKIINKEGKEKVRSECCLNHLENLERLQGLQDIEMLQQYCNGSAITRYNASYEDIEIKPNSFIYCDPPYKNVKQFANSTKFNHNEFWDIMREWSKHNMVFISEQEAPDDFICIWEKQVSRTIIPKAIPKATEKLFIHKDRYKDYIYCLEVDNDRIRKSK